jgi:methylated-DNA-[protein]-cysteine S-methyltransferase
MRTSTGRRSAEDPFHLERETRYGTVTLAWSARTGRPLITRVWLPRRRKRGGMRRHPQSLAPSRSGSSEIDRAADDIQAFLDGENVRFRLDIADLAICTEFQRKVLRAEHRIPRGSVSTYRLIARHLGVERGARAVGGALAANPFPIIVPCHRAIRSDRRPGGYQGGPAMKMALLEMEGITFDGAGRAMVHDFYY